MNEAQSCCGMLERFISLTTLQRVTYSSLEPRSTENQAKWKAGLLCWENKANFVVSKLSSFERLGDFPGAGNERAVCLHFLALIFLVKGFVSGGKLDSEGRTIGDLKDFCFFFFLF